MRRFLKPAVLTLALLLPAGWVAAATCCSPQQLSEDLAHLQREIARVHPQPDFSADQPALARAYAELSTEFSKASLTPEQAWLRLSRLNPLFNDAHFFVNQPARQAQTRAHLQAGGKLFPFEVQVDGRGELRIRALLGGAPTPLAGARIDVINGLPALQVARELLSHMHGDTPAFRANILSTRWYYPFWQRYGAPRQFDFQLEQAGVSRRLSLPASAAQPLNLQDELFEDSYRLELLPRQAALLTVKSFLWDDKPRYLAWAEDAFRQIKQAGVRHLIIDVRANGGGDDDMWKDGLLRYIADKPYRNGSDYIKMVIAGRASGSEQVGDLVQGQVDSWVQPELDHPLHFKGKLHVLIGRFTYSSSVLFSNVVQDFGFGQLVGAEPYVRSRQSGGIQSATLPHSKLQLVVPRFVLTRPSGQREPLLLTPDLLLPDSPFDERELVNALLARL